MKLGIAAPSVRDVDLTGGDATPDVPVAADTAFRCIIALLLVRLGMRLIRFGADRLSSVHPARRAYSSAVIAWDDRVSEMPWRGFIPTSPSVISPTQFAWFIVFAVAVNTMLHFLGLPHVPLPYLREHVPHLTHRLVRPRA